MQVETPSIFAKVIQDHLELKERNAKLEGAMPLGHYKAADPFDNHPLFKTEEQARLEETMDGEDGAAGEGPPDPLGELGPAGDVGARQDEDELLPAPAPSEVDVPDGLLQKHGELTQDCVARGMTVAVVDVLEPVEVGHDDCQGAAETLDTGELVFEGLLALAPVGETREAVDQRLPFHDSVQPCVVERHHRMGSE